MPFLTDFLQWIAPLTGGRQFTAVQMTEITSLTRWFFPYVFFIGLTVFQMGPLFIMKHYSTPSWGPALLNVTIIIACWFMRGWFSNPLYALVVGVWAGGIAQLAVQNVAMRKHVGVWLPNFDLRHPGIKTAFLLLVPVILGQSAGEVNKFINSTFAYSLGDGVRTAMWVGNIVVQLPLSIFGLAISAAILPSISRAAARKDFAEVRETLMRGMRQCYFLIAPAVAAMLVLPVPIIRLLFQRHEFTAEDTALTAVVLAYLAMGLLFFAWVKVAVAGFYAVQNTRKPVAIAFTSMLVNILLLMVLVRPLGYISLPLATTLSFALNFALLYIFLSRRYGLLWDREFRSSLARTTLAAIMAAVVFHATAAAVHHYWPQDSLLNRLVMVALPLGFGFLIYIGACGMMKLPELADFASLSRRQKAPLESAVPERKSIAAGD
jgi:putative peptidoglycan lipid II flippase